MKPFLLSPAYKNYLWGGNKLETKYQKQVPFATVAESWECSVHPDGLSTIASGPFSGQTLAAFLEHHPEALGERAARYDEFPILVKFVDADKDLSIQVHPDDTFARVNEGQMGKTEMWYVLSAEPGATLVYGFAHDVTAETVRRAIKDNTLLVHLQTMPVHEGDVFLIEPGVVHAVGGGVLLAGVQENSNVTYRVYDYGRKDENGSLRTLHTEKALAVMKFSASSPVRQRQRIIQYTPGMARELICRCHYFQVERIRVAKRSAISRAQDTFFVLLIVDGKGRISAEGEQLEVSAGSTVFVPAGQDELAVEGVLQMLLIRI